MKILSKLVTGLSLFILFSTQALATLPATSMLPPALSTDASLAPILQKVLPTVVNIRADIKITDLTVLFQLLKQHEIQINNGQIPDTILSVGSGVIVDGDKGYIITNAHVVNDAQSIIVTLDDGRHYTAKLIGLDKASDVALLQIKAKGLPALPIGNSRNLKVGDVVAAIGNPFGLNQSVTSGIISALGRSSLGIENIENFIQTDAPINPGNSGGALINTRGELIGINTAILAPDRGSIGIGFAIPAVIVKTVMQQLIQYGDVKRGMLGIGVQDVTPDLARAFNIFIPPPPATSAASATSSTPAALFKAAKTGKDGKDSKDGKPDPNAQTQVLPPSSATQGAMVTATQLGSPAEKAGIIVGDIIKAVNFIPIKNANDIISTVGFLRVDSKVFLNITRDNNPIMITVVLTDPKKLRELASQIDPFFFGVGMQNFFLLSPIHGEINGVMVVSVDPDSHAWQADLRPGDVITSVDEKKITNINDMKAAAGRDKPSIVLNVLRGAGAVFLIVNKEDN